MSDSAALVYLEADDEITTLVRRVRASDAARVVVVAPGRSRATSSAVALRLLARVGAQEGTQIVVVGDPLTRSLATEAGLPAFASVEEARSASIDGMPVATDEPRHAAIHVVRGAGSDDTVAAPLAVSPEASPAARPDSASPTDETRAAPVVPPPAAERPRRAARPASPSGRRATAAGGGMRRPAGPAVALAIAAALLLAGAVAGATFLPAATITVVPRAVPISASYELTVDDPERATGTVEATATVTASGTYETVERATGTVTFRNFNSGNVEVPAGTLVAAGEQAFETTEAVTVPSGSLVPSGVISAGEADAPIVAAAPGPDANVDAEAIDTVLSQGVAARLRLFPQNSARLVINAEPTAGGRDRSGPEITDDDVAAAVEELRAELRRLADEARPELAGLVVVETPPAEPVIGVPDDLAGTRDTPEVTIDGSLEWEVVGIDPTQLEAQAAERLASSPSVPAGHTLLDDSVSVDLGTPERDGDAVVVEATVDALTAPDVTRDEILERAIGLTEPEAELALTELGDAEVELWPGWVESVPELEWRIDVRIEATAR